MPSMMMKSVATLGCLLAFLAHTVSAGLYTAKDNVISVNSNNFNSVVMDTEHPVAVEFYAPWCGHCKQLAPEYVKAATSLQGLAKLVAVDCDEQSNQALCGRFGVKGFPTIKVFSGGIKGMPEDYNGERKSKAIVDYLISKITHKYVKQIGIIGKKTVSLEDFVKENDMPRMVFVNKKDTTSPLLKALSVEYKDRLTVGEVKGAYTKFVEKITTKIPGVFIWPKDTGITDTPVEYEGELKQKPLKEFLEKYALPPTKSKKPTKEEKKPKLEEKKKDDAFKKPLDLNIPELKSQTDLEELCLDQSGVCVISFIANDEEYPEFVAEHLTHLNIIQNVKQTMHKKPHNPFTFVQVNPLQHGLQLVKDFQASDMYPSILAVNFKRKAYGLLRAAFEEESITKFLTDLISGKGSISKFDLVPTLDKGDKAKADAPVRDGEL
ncbi:hypothetical protein O5D80_000574 [Batrachochytrium dendrobatidis]|nr:hypothetical protein O5D80_000574 [Batrachochytrium dendrobatidis]